MLLITDANIFMDLEKVDLLKYLDNLPFTFATSDFVFNELNPQQKELVSQLEVEVYELEAMELMTFHQEFTALGQLNISFQDYSVFYHAKKYNGSVLSNDKRLRNFSKVREVPVRGLFYILDELTLNNVVTKNMMTDKLNLLKEINNWLPLNEINKRLDNLNS